VTTAYDLDGRRHLHAPAADRPHAAACGARALPFVSDIGLRRVPARAARCG